MSYHEYTIGLIDDRIRGLRKELDAKTTKLNSLNEMTQDIIGEMAAIDEQLDELYDSCLVAGS